MNNIIGRKFFSKVAEQTHEESLKQAAFNSNFSTEKKFQSAVLGQSVLCSYRRHSSSKPQESSPMFQDKDGRYGIVFDGEIYNFRELKNELLRDGISFSTDSEVEVLLQYLIKKGTDGIKKLNGVFAFAFYDSLEDELMLVRDHLGVKPLLYSVQEEEIIFASDLSFFKQQFPKVDINPKALNAFFRFTYIPAPDTILLGIHKLLPGHFLKVKNDSLSMVCYYSVREAQKMNISYEDALVELKKKLENAVIERLDDFQNNATFLSGGVDSSIVSYIVQKHQNELDTFSVGFRENEYFDESKYAENVAHHIHANHHVIKLGKEEIQRSFKDILSVFDEPYGDSSVVAMYFLIRYTKENATVALSGDGADELLIGYNKHKAYLKSKKPGFLLQIATNFAVKIKGGNRRGKFSNRLRQLKRFGLLMKEKWPESYWFLAQHITKTRRDNLLVRSKVFQNHVAPGKDNLSDFIYTDQEFLLPNDMLKKVDVMARYFEFAVRPPFLSIDVVDFVNGLHEEYKLKNNIGKRILRDAYRDVLPSEVFSRSKRGFEIPLHSWIAETWTEITNSKWFDAEYLDLQGIFTPEGVQQLNEDFKIGTEEDATVTMWCYIVFQNWYDRWKEK